MHCLEAMDPYPYFHIITCIYPTEGDTTKQAHTQDSICNLVSH